MSYLVRRQLGDIETPCVKVCPPKQPWAFLDRVSTLATAVTAVGILWSLWRKR